MSRYVVAIAGAFTMWTYPDRPDLQQPLPSDCTVTYIPDYSWPLWHAAFERDDLTGLWWFAQAVDAAPVLAAAVERFTRDRAELQQFVSPLDWRGVRGNALVCEQILLDLQRHPDNEIAWGRE